MKVESVRRMGNNVKDRHLFIFTKKNVEVKRTQFRVTMNKKVFSRVTGMKFPVERRWEGEMKVFTKMIPIYLFNKLITFSILSLCFSTFNFRTMAEDFHVVIAHFIISHNSPVARRMSIFALFRELFVWCILFSVTSNQIMWNWCLKFDKNRLKPPHVT